MRRLVLLMLPMLLSGCFCTFSKTPVKAELEIEPSILGACASPAPPSNRSEAEVVRWAQDARSEARCYRAKRDALVRVIEPVVTIKKP